LGRRSGIGYGDDGKGGGKREEASKELGVVLGLYIRKNGRTIKCLDIGRLIQCCKASILLLGLRESFSVIHVTIHFTNMLLGRIQEPKIAIATAQSLSWSAP
jgi:hypothetical protein